MRTGEPEPAPEAQRAAIRDVIRHCLYAVDRNPLAVDLCKVALWIEGHNTGRPLSFLDHHVRCGDSLIGVFDLAALERGIPDDAYRPLTGDDKQVARDLKTRNRREREGQQTLELFASPDLAGATAQLARAARELEAVAEDSPAAVQAKEHRYHAFRELDADFRRLRQACDLWTAAFFAPLRPPRPGEPERIPTTDHVLRALRGQPGIQGVLPTALELAAEHRFFHWPLEFPEVFAQGGFDVALGNPPWERIKLQEQEFFASRDRAIAQAPNKAARERLIRALKEGNPALAAAFDAARHAAEAASLFVRASGRFPLTAVGDVNTYALFAELFLRLPSARGRAGFIVPTGIATDNSTKAFFDEVTGRHRLASLLDFENRERVFPGIDSRIKFCLLTLASDVPATTFTFFVTNTEQLRDPRRRIALSPEDIALINPNTRTCPVFRSQADAELTRKIYRRVPVLIDEAKGEAGNPWGITFLAMFHMANDSGLFVPSAALLDGAQPNQPDNALTSHIFAAAAARGLLPLYEAKMIHHFDHRWATYAADGRTTRDAGDAEKQDPAFRPLPRYWVPAAEVEARLSAKGWRRGWLLGWRDICCSTNERTVIAAAIPRVGVGNKFLLMLPATEPRWTSALFANLASLVFDYVARQKVGGTSLTYFTMKQLTTLPPSAYDKRDLAFITPRVLELTCTAWDMQPFARDLGYEGAPFRWDPERRALLRAELDAYFAWLYGLTRDELRYVLDPKEVMGEDFPSETFRVLKERELKEFGEYRTRRLVLEAYDRFATDGTFDAARLEDPEYFPVVRQALKVSRSREEELARSLEELLARSDKQALPTLFVEGRTDQVIVEGAWRALFPDAPLPVAVLPAGGTTQMRSLAAPGRAMRELLGERLVMALADNDGEGRALWREGRLHKGGVWRQQSNGVWWCLLRPSEEFLAVIERFQIPRACWPFTIENAFSAALRRQALAEGTYGFADHKVQSDLTRDPEVAQKVIAVIRDLDEADDAYFYLMAPSPEAKDAFAAWVSDPARLRPENFAAFEVVLSRLKELLGGRGRPSDARRTA